MSWPWLLDTGGTRCVYFRNSRSVTVGGRLDGVALTQQTRSRSYRHSQSSSSFSFLALFKSHFFYLVEETVARLR